MSLFDASPQQVAGLVAACPLAWIVSRDGDGFASTPLPLLGELDDDGAVISLFGHFAKRNRHVPILERDPRATILFQGPQGYISPNLVSNPIWGATWNYAVARFDVELRFVPEETDESVRRLAAMLERDSPTPWTPDRMGARYDQLIHHIIAFRATVLSTNACFKLGQDERPETFDEIVAGLGVGPLAQWMTAAARARP